ncbi:MAG: VOC family protein [Betaproteobacteria bacterium]|nr:VOC family protein [Betaproteobacteria bacterium]
MKRFNYKGVNHVHINVTDIKRSIAFYTEVLGFQVAGRKEPDKAWLNFGQYGAEEKRWLHNLALTQVSERNDLYWDRSGLNHFALEVDSIKDVDEIGAALKEQGVKIVRGPGVHAEDMTYHVYLEDPDGNVIEIMTQTAETDTELRKIAQWAPDRKWRLLSET